jgi:Fe2+ or Zn2+ uptake regulation protein
MQVDLIIKKLKENQCRITPQRKAILDILAQHQYKLLTADALLELCQESNPDINLTTIYRNIELLDQLNLLYKMNIDRNTTAYKFICGNHHHHHLICLGCGKLVPIEYCPITTALTDLVESKDFILTDHNLELFGYCKDCR